ncbi:lysophospholipid acyltransferase [Dinochytrium kinnereticum]|nr:lysophospholipid acyltransferase [Dinochytrium kinnereticum]
MFDEELGKVARDLDVPVDSLKAGGVLLASYVFAIFFFFLPKHGALGAAIRHAYSILISTSLFVLLFGVSGIIELVATSMIIYALTYYGKSNKNMPVACFLLVLGHLSFALLRTQVFASDSARFDVTAPMMILVIKLSSFGWSVYDATRPDSELSDEQKKRAVRKFPSILEYLGYVFFFPSFLVGPALDFRDYQAFINIEEPFNNIPSRVLPVLTSLLYAVVSLVAYVKCASAFSYENATTAEFLQRPLWHRFLFLQVAGLISRVKFYVAWKLAEGACDLTGIGFTGRDAATGKHVWTRGANVDIIGMEFGANPKAMIGAWNMKTGAWLRNYVYLRLTKPGQKPHPIVAIITYMVSAFWHGFYPGYYLTFLVGSFLNLAGRNLRRSLRPMFVAPSKLAPFKPLYDILAWGLSLAAINFSVGPFQVWALDKSLAVWASVAYIPLIVIVFFGIGVEITGAGWAIRSFGRAVGAVYGGGSTNVKLFKSHANGVNGKAVEHVNGNGVAVKGSSSNGVKKID